MPAGTFIAAISVVTIHQAKTQLSQLIVKAGRGEEVVFARGGNPVLRLVALAPVTPRPKFGGWERRIKMADDFDAELEDFADCMHPVVQS